MSPKERKTVLLRLDPAVHDAVARWAADELRSTNAHVEYLLRRALAQVGRLPKEAGPLPQRGRPPKDPAAADEAAPLPDAPASEPPEEDDPA